MFVCMYAGNTTQAISLISSLNDTLDRSRYLLEQLTQNEELIRESIFEEAEDLLVYQSMVANVANLSLELYNTVVLTYQQVWVSYSIDSIFYEFVLCCYFFI